MSSGMTDSLYMVSQANCRVKAQTVAPAVAGSDTEPDRLAVSALGHTPMVGEGIDQSEPSVTLFLGGGMPYDRRIRVRICDFDAQVTFPPVHG